MGLNLTSSRRYLISVRAVSLRSTMARVIYWVIIMLCILGGAWLLAGLNNPIGYTILGLGALIYAWQLWVSRALYRVAPDQGNSIDSVLSSNILGRLPSSPSPADVAKALNFSRGGRFFAARYGITPDIVMQISSKDAKDLDNIWHKAYELQQRYGGETVGGSAMMAALISQSPLAKDFLSRISLDEKDIESGAEWFNHVHGIFKNFRAPRKTGGFARDWAFGFTPLLERFGSNITNSVTLNNRPIVELKDYQPIISQAIKMLDSGVRKNIALIGQLGVGKMSIVELLADKLMYSSSVPKSLKHNQVVALDSSRLIATSPNRAELENLINRILLEAHRAKNIIICLDNAQLFFEEGAGSIDLSNLFIPILEGGALKIILTMDEQRWLQISQRIPALSTSLNRVSVKSPGRHDVLRVLQAQILAIEHQSKVVFMYRSLIEAYELGDKYIREQSMPGKAIKLLESSVNFAENGFVTDSSVRSAVEQMTGVKVGRTQDAEEKNTLLNLESLIHERMINQEQAVKVVSDALRRARAGVSSDKRPIGTFLFLGPTGVGKTELSKALASIYFGGEEHIIRIDLNEYVSSSDVTRLIADGSSNEHSLAAQLSKQPFSVVLLDEIEKAHPDVLSTLLQMLDEGVLRDINGREIRSQDAIVIATSNAGASQIYKHLESSNDIDALKNNLVNTLINENIFRPEFINRFDEVVIFKPLGKDDLRKVVDLILNDLNKTLNNRKIKVELSDRAKDMLVEAGYDPQFGARPMRRVVQRTVENVIAKRILEGSASDGQLIKLETADIESSLE